jgi:hypothetical protein
MTTTGGKDINSVTVSARNGVESLRQNRNSGIEVIPSHPSTLLLGSGVLGLAQML